MVLDLLEQEKDGAETLRVQKLLSIMETLLTHSTTQYSNTIRHRRPFLQLIYIDYTTPQMYNLYKCTILPMYNFKNLFISVLFSHKQYSSKVFDTGK